MKKLPRVKVPVSFCVPFDFLAEIDNRIAEGNTSRSEFIVQAIKEKLNREKINK